MMSALQTLSCYIIIVVIIIVIIITNK